jgi:hypothetical protein
MKRISYLGLLLFCSIWQNVSAQDKIYKTNGEIIEVKVTEVGTNEIKYHLYQAKNGPIYILQKLDISKIEYEDGRKEVYEIESDESELNGIQKTSAIKINFLSPVFGYIGFNYEKSIRKGRSMEFSLGLIGLGFKQVLDYGYSSNKTIYSDQLGAFVSAGYKFIKVSDKIRNVTNQSNLFQGWYLKPQVIFGSYKANEVYYNYTDYTNYYEKKTTIFGGLLINVGKQWVFSDFILLDLYGGVGYDINNRSSVNGNNYGYYGNPSFHYGVLSTGTDGVSGLGLTGGLKVGILIGR